jgi:hypothetical protein
MKRLQPEKRAELISGSSWAKGAVPQRRKPDNNQLGSSPFYLRLAGIR